MSFQQLLTMRPAVLSGKALWLQVVTILERSWQQSGSGPLRWCRFPIRFFRYVVMIMFGVLLLSRRMRIIVSAYCWFRIVDDILDGDRKAPVGYSPAAYRERINTLMAHLYDLERCPLTPRPEDLLLAHIVKTCQKKRVTVVREMRSLWSIMSWDFDRRQTMVAQSKSALQNNAALQDRVIINVCVKMLGGDVTHIDNLAELSCGVFTRVDWVVDVASDLAAGIINIPADAVLRHSIDLQAALLAARKSEKHFLDTPGVRQWRDEELALIRRQWHALRRPLAAAFISSFRWRLQAMVLHRPLVRTFEYTLNKASH